MSLARHTIYNVAGQVAPLIVTVLTVPLYLKVVGLERYGLLAICWTLLSFVQFIGLGLGPAVARHIALLKDADATRRSNLVWTAMAISGGLALVGFLAVLFAAQFYFRAVQIHSTPLQIEVHRAIPWLALLFAVNLAGAPLGGALQGRQKFGSLNVITVSSFTLMAVVPLCIAIAFGPSLPFLIIATVAASIFTFAAQLIVCKRAVPLLRPTARLLTVGRELASYGGWMTVIAIVAPLVMVADRFVIGSMLGAAAVSIYVIANNLVSRSIILPAALGNAALPRLAAASPAEERQVADTALRTLMVILTPASVVGIALVGPFLHVWVGSALGTEASKIACVLILGYWCHGIAHIPGHVLLGRGRPDIVAKVLVGYVPLYFALLWGLLSAGGLFGAAWAWTIRAAFDFVFFHFSPIERRRTLELILSGAIVITTTMIALLSAWQSAPYWIAMAICIGAAGWQAWHFAPADLSRRASNSALRLRLKLLSPGQGQKF